MISAFLCSCQSVRYYSQAVEGQCRILLKRKPISEIVEDSECPENLRAKLKSVLEIREFARTDLQLPVDNHYLTYVDLERPFVLWNVFAAPEFSLEPKTWCYPVAGCSAYRGYFSENDARRYADSMEKQGYDVYVGGVTAYSTLGWFDDPLLSTFLRYPMDRTAALMFHELAHQMLYVPGDTEFNENFATAVEQESLRRWQQAHGSMQLYHEYVRRFQLRQQFVALVMHCRQRLEKLYGSDRAQSEKRVGKAAVFLELREEFNLLKSRQNEFSVYDTWINQPLNNAKIGSMAAYNDFLPAFQRILSQNGGNLDRFYEACRQISQRNKEERHRILNSYMLN